MNLFLVFCMQDRPKQGTLDKGLQEEKHYKDENNSGELKVGIDIPLKTV